MDVDSFTRTTCLCEAHILDAHRPAVSACVFPEVDSLALLPPPFLPSSVGSDGEEENLSSSCSVGFCQGHS